MMSIGQGRSPEFLAMRGDGDRDGLKVAASFFSVFGLFPTFGLR
jgi:hypothetical protein